jgi:glucose/arabinose dehydrogenase
MQGKSEGMVYRVEQLIDNMDIIWGLAFLSTDQLILTHRGGGISLFNTSNFKITKLKGSPVVFASGQGGMLDVAVQNNYKPGDWIYFTYSKPLDDEAATTLARAKLRGDRLAEWQDLLVTQSRSSSGYHFGSRIAFDSEGHLFFTIGDRHHRPNGQDLQTHAGSILRLTLDGKIPLGNPFITKKNILPEIWSFGHRNPQGIAYDHKHKQLWAIEHGPRGGDEINLIEPGNNYGWPVISHGKEYTSPLAVGEGTEKPGMEQPVKVYIPSIAPGCLLFYTGSAFPAWQGNLFSGALKLRHINRVVLNDKNKATEEERLITKLKERIRSLAESPEGWIYVGTDSGKILRILPDK